MGRLSAVSDPETHGPVTGSKPFRFNEPKVPECGPFGNYQFTRNGIQSNMAVEKANIERSRAFVIENVPSDLSYLTLAGFFNVSEPER